MRFADLDGTMIDVYQAATQMTDESGQTYPFTIDTLLDSALGAEGYYGVVHREHAHRHASTHAGSDAIVASAQAAACRSSRPGRCSTWLDGRNASSFESDLPGTAARARSASRSTSAPAPTACEAMLPTSSDRGPLTAITRDGSRGPVHDADDQGRRVRVLPGHGRRLRGHLRGVTPSTPPRRRSPTSARPANGDGTATITWTTNEASDSRVDYGTDPGTLDQNAATPPA